MVSKGHDAMHVARLAGWSVAALLAIVCVVIWQAHDWRPRALPLPAESAPVAVRDIPNDFDIDGPSVPGTTAVDVVVLPEVSLGEKPNPDGPGATMRSPAAAAELACWYANEKCLRQWGRAPFSPYLYVAHFKNERWFWGEYDPAGPGGFSAEVSFARDGSDVRVQINFSIDTADDLLKGGNR